MIICENKWFSSRPDSCCRSGVPPNPSHSVLVYQALPPIVLAVLAFSSHFPCGPSYPVTHYVAESMTVSASPPIRAGVQLISVTRGSNSCFIYLVFQYFRDVFVTDDTWHFAPHIHSRSNPICCIFYCWLVGKWGSGLNFPHKKRYGSVQCY